MIINLFSLLHFIPSWRLQPGHKRQLNGFCGLRSSDGKMTTFLATDTTTTRPGAFVTVTRAHVTRDTAELTFAPPNIGIALHGSHGTVLRTTSSSSPHDKERVVHSRYYNSEIFEPPRSRFQFGHSINILSQTKYFIRQHSLPSLLDVFPVL